MSNAQRYNPRYLRDCDGDWFTTGSEESEDGRYVLHSDYATLLSRHNALVEVLRRIAYADMWTLEKDGSGAGEQFQQMAEAALVGEE